VGQGHHRLANLKKLSLGVSHQLQKHATLPTALASKAPHHLAEITVQGRRLGPQRGCVLGALVGDVLDDLEDFFFAL
jgi:hypothetical protein